MEVLVKEKRPDEKKAIIDCSVCNCKFSAMVKEGVYLRALHYDDIDQVRFDCPWCNGTCLASIQGFE